MERRAPRKLSRRRVALLARASRAGVLTVADAARALKLDARATAIALGALARQGWLSRVRRAVYVVVPLEALGSAGVAATDPWTLAEAVFRPCYIGGWSAAEHWGLTEQVFRSTFVVTAAHLRQRHATIGGAEYRLVRVSSDRVAGIDSVWRGNVRVPVSDAERTIVDGANSPDWVGGCRHLASMLKAYRSNPGAEEHRLVTTLAKWGRGAGRKRLGYLTELVWPEAKHVVAAARKSRTAGVVKLDPSVRTKGKLNTRWGLWINVTIGPESAS